MKRKQSPEEQQARHMFDMAKSLDENGRAYIEGYMVGRSHERKAQEERHENSPQH